MHLSIAKHIVRPDMHLQMSSTHLIARCCICQEHGPALAEMKRPLASCVVHCNRGQLFEAGGNAEFCCHYIELASSQMSLRNARALIYAFCNEAVRSRLKQVPLASTLQRLQKAGEHTTPQTVLYLNPGWYALPFLYLPTTLRSFQAKGTD